MAYSVDCFKPSLHDAKRMKSQTSAEPKVLQKLQWRSPPVGINGFVGKMEPTVGATNRAYTWSTTSVRNSKCFMKFRWHISAIVAGFVNQYTCIKHHP
jgi:hypothetical protein